MESKPNHIEGLAKWAVLGATVVALECIGKDSLTTHARNALEHPVGRIVVPILGAVTLLHLLDRMPEQVDPYMGVAHLIERVNHGTH